MIVFQGCAITLTRCPGLLIFRVGLAKTNAVVAHRATKLRSKYKIDRNHVQVNSNENHNRQSFCRVFFKKKQQSFDWLWHLTNHSDHLAFWNKLGSKYKPGVWSILFLQPPNSGLSMFWCHYCSVKFQVRSRFFTDLF